MEPTKKPSQNSTSPSSDVPETVSEVLVATSKKRNSTAKIMVCILGSLVVLGAITFGVHQLVESTQRQTGKAAPNSVQAQAEAGIYDFDGGYQQLYPKYTTQARFVISKIEALDMATVPGFGKDAPHYTHYVIRDKNNDRIEFSLWQTKATITAFNPPSYCDNPDPVLNYSDYRSQLGTYSNTCTTLRDIDGVGTLYGRDKDDKYPTGGTYTNEAKERAAGYYEWYYLKSGDTLLTIEDSQKTLGTDGAASFFSNLVPIAPADLLAKSKALAAGQNDTKSSGKSVNFTVYAPSKTLGLSLIGSYLDENDSANPVIAFKYDNNNSFDTVGYTIHEYRRPQKFAPPYCGYESPGLGVPSNTCKSIGTTTAGKTVYSDGYFYWGDFGDTIISINGVHSTADAMTVFGSMTIAPVTSLSLQ